MFRKVLFWSHLSVGIAISVAVLIMSITGIIIAYEAQIEQWANRKADPVIIPADARALSADEMVARLESSGEIDWPIRRIELSSDPEEVAVVGGITRDLVYRVNPYTAEEVGPGNLAVEKFFSVNIRLHRWLNIDG